MAEDRPARVVEKENEDARNAAYAAGLKRELEGYKRSGNKDRAAQVEKELRRVGGSKAAGPAESTAGSGGAERTTSPPPPRRKSATKKSSAKKS